jgi:hypothetical protein
MHPLSNFLLYAWVCTTLWDLMTATEAVRMDVCHELRPGPVDPQQEVLVQGDWYTVQGIAVDADGFQYISYYKYFGPCFDASPLMYDAFVIFVTVYVVDKVLFGKTRSNRHGPKRIGASHAQMTSEPSYVKHL